MANQNTAAKLNYMDCMFCISTKYKEVLFQILFPDIPNNIFGLCSRQMTQNKVIVKGSELAYHGLDFCVHLDLARHCFILINLTLLRRVLKSLPSHVLYIVQTLFHY